MEKGRGRQKRWAGGRTAQTRAGGQACLDPRCGPRTLIDSLLAGSGSNGAWAGSLEDMPSSPSCLSSQDEFSAA